MIPTHIKYKYVNYLSISYLCKMYQAYVTYCTFRVSQLGLQNVGYNGMFNRKQYLSAVYLCDLLVYIINI